MARPSILDRFRPVGAPGAAGPAGVPAADDLGPEAELVAVFAALDAEVESCRRLVEDARRDAEKEVAGARERAAALVAQARLDAGAEQARSAAEVLRTAADVDAKLLDQARQEAAELTESGTDRLPEAVRRVIDTLLAEQLSRR